MRAKVFNTQILSDMGLSDISSRSIKNCDFVEIACECGTIKSLLWSTAYRAYKKTGSRYRCISCVRSEAANRPEVRQKLKENAIKRSKQISESNKINKTKYLPEHILKVLENSGVTFSGDISNPGNSIKVFWDDGVSRSIRIRRFMSKGVVERPKTGDNNSNYLKSVENLSRNGIKITKIGQNLAELSYKGVIWQQAWFGSIDKTCKRKMKNIDLSIRMKEHVDAGLSISAACKIEGIDFNRYYRNLKVGISVEQTAITTRSTERLIEIAGAVYNKALDGSNYRPDILIEDKKLIIEVDGLIWHSEKFKNRSYHFNRYDVLSDLGYTVLAFSEQQVKEKRKIVDSMINHKLGKSLKIFARKCQVKELCAQESAKFFEENHLMGAGSGKSIALVSNDDIVCAIRFRTENNELHISRFACKVGLNVVGGYSKLLSRLPENTDIVNFVDRRHGNGKHLINLGYSVESTHIGFDWTDGYSSWNRRSFLGNSGYERNLLKVFDYGQIKYVKRINKKS